MGTKYASLVGSSATKTKKDILEELVSIGKKNAGHYRQKYIVAAFLGKTNVTALFSSIPNHAAPLSINLVSNAILKSIDSKKDYNIKTAIHPLATDSVFEAALPNDNLLLTVPFLFASFLAVALAISPSCFIVFPVEEKLCKVRTDFRKRTSYRYE